MKSKQKVNNNKLIILLDHLEKRVLAAYKKFDGKRFDAARYLDLPIDFYCEVLRKTVNKIGLKNNPAGHLRLKELLKHADMRENLIPKEELRRFLK